MKAMREMHEAERKKAIDKHETAMQALKAADKELRDMTERDKREISASMQAFETKVTAL